MDHELCVTTLMGSILQTDVIFRNCPLSAAGKSLPVHLVKIERQAFNIILRMDWLAKY